MKLEVGTHVFDLSKKRCETCERSVHYVRPNRGRRGYWQHDGDGLTQYRSWKAGR